ncbi:Sua5 family C-terminal domain-containing protein [Lentilactobacillus rapi]|uniref:Sua5 family C-terminal domain-containing protein n=1 Tax=Lentilactobacillus rapi TaxID=481723 RepID=UPI000AA3364D
MKYKHYAPDAQVYIVDPDDNWQEVADWIGAHQQPVGVMAFNDVINSIDWPKKHRRHFARGRRKIRCHDLFAELRDFDNHKQYKIVFAQGLKPTGIAEAYMNRLNKSAGQMHFKQL